LSRKFAAVINGRKLGISQALEAQIPQNPRAVTVPEHNQPNEPLSSTKPIINYNALKRTRKALKRADWYQGSTRRQKRLQGGVIHLTGIFRNEVVDRFRIERLDKSRKLFDVVHVLLQVKIAGVFGV
jgi:hypothetical protein